MSTSNSETLAILIDVLLYDYGFSIEQLNYCFSLLPHA